MSHALQRSVLLACILAALVSAPATAAVLYEQLPGADGFVSDNKTTPDNWTQMEADSFVLEEAAEVTSVEFWCNTSLGQFTTFQVLFLPDAGGVPSNGALTSNGFVGVPQVEDGAYVRYTVTYPAGVGPRLDAGVTYWISVVGMDDYSGEPAWSEVFRWAADSTAQGYARSDDGGITWSAANFNQPAFRLLGDVVAVAAPSWSRVKALFR